ncbi:hypothetical protein [Bradyrhizobium elkanii]|uniref:hypothetical protein n=1 Tax=Bradyrhizobium elkanii TaxID=29448 RepID=UPI002169403B|nr:hypothetical protein [Bradyrhizobium elkanii]MCS3690916.1 hypothetical protein [Bradyrhizobium elkanii]
MDVHFALVAASVAGALLAIVGAAALFVELRNRWRMHRNAMAVMEERGDAVDERRQVYRRSGGERRD